MSTAQNTAQIEPNADHLITKNSSFRAITDQVCRVVESKISIGWLLALGFFGSLAMVMQGAIGYLVWEGVGVFGNNNPNGWGWPIVNFVFWVGIGHAGTLISAILFLFRQKWRTAINRSAEAMTIFAVICAGIYPGIHIGRAWLPYYMFPVPNQMQMWPNFRSPLMWDIFAVGSYFTVSLMFWYVGLVPDMATLRDRAKNKFIKVFYAVLSLGWRGGNRQWRHYEKAYLILAGLATPLVLSVHTVVSFDFATSVIPGWHTTIFPPYFVAGAIFSGFAMVMTLLIIVRKVYKMENIITIYHLENMCKIMLVTGMMVGYAYSCEFFVAWYSGNAYELAAFKNRAFGHYAWAYWIMVSCNVLVPQLFWRKKWRTSIPLMFVASILINVGMWFERFVIIITSISQDFLPGSWGFFTPTIWDVLIFVGSIGLFLTLFLIFIRTLPMVAMAEVKGVTPAADPHHHDKEAA